MGAVEIIEISHPCKLFRHRFGAALASASAHESCACFAPCSHESSRFLIRPCASLIGAADGVPSGKSARLIRTSTTRTILARTGLRTSLILSITWHVRAKQGGKTAACEYRFSRAPSPKIGEFFPKPVLRCRALHLRSGSGSRTGQGHQPAGPKLGRLGQHWLLAPSRPVGGCVCRSIPICLKKCIFGDRPAFRFTQKFAAG